MEIRKPAITDCDTLKILGDGVGYKGFFMVRCYDSAGDRVHPNNPAMGMDLPAVRVDIDQTTFPADSDLLQAIENELIAMGHTIA